MNQFSSDRKHLSSLYILTITVSKGPPRNISIVFQCSIKTLKWNFRVKSCIFQQPYFYYKIRLSYKVNIFS